MQLHNDAHDMAYEHLTKVKEVPLERLQLEMALLEPYTDDMLYVEKGIEADHMAFMNACRGAVKANQRLSISEMRRLIEDMRKIPNPWACVHGRPTALRIDIDSLDHHFGRHG